MVSWRLRVMIAILASRPSTGARVLLAELPALLAFREHSTLPSEFTLMLKSTRLPSEGPLAPPPNEMFTLGTSLLN